MLSSKAFLRNPRHSTRRSPTRWTVRIAITLSIFVIGAFFFKEIAGLTPNTNFRVQFVHLMPLGHLNPGERPPVYDSNPPTSGLHSPNLADWGQYSRVIPDAVVIHNLEHGGILLSYKDPLDIDFVSVLQNIVKRYPKQLILTYRPRNDSQIAVVLWGKLLKLDVFDEGQIEDFIDRYRFKGPENG